MLATLIDKPFDDEEWLFEIKLDGFRAIAKVDGPRVRLLSRNQKSFNDRFPGIVEALKALNVQAVFDGEIVAVDNQGRPSFQDLQNRKPTHLRYVIFDLLYLDGRDLRQLPLIERKQILKKVLKKSPPSIVYLDHVEHRGKAFFKACTEMGLEGIIGKLKKSTYLDGKRSKGWVKIKGHMRQEVVICGFTEPKGGRKEFGALIVGVYKGNKLRYAGRVGGGFSDEQLEALKELLLPFVQKDSPFAVTPKIAAAIWVKPQIIGEVSFREWTTEGLMRQPIFMGLRDDKPPKQVKREKAKPHKSR